MPQTSVHGGDIYNHNIQYDFSVNINPLPPGDFVIERMKEAVSAYDIYPETDNIRLREAIGKRTGRKKEQVICGNGASELLSAVMHAFRPKEVLIPQPAFEGYAWAAQMVDAKLMDFRTLEQDGFALTERILEALKEKPDLLILTNPSNPAGRLIRPELLKLILEKCRDLNIMVLLDECFIEFTSQESACTLLDSFENLMIVRAFTKIYAMPGIRLGYLLASEELCSRIHRQLPEWNLSVIAQAAGLAVMEKTLDSSYLIDTRRVIQKEREYLKEELINESHGGIVVFPSEANFLLLKSGHPLYDLLLEHKILIRDCSNYPGLGRGYYRIAVRGHEENQKLIRGIRLTLGQ